MSNGSTWACTFTGEVSSLLINDQSGQRHNKSLGGAHDRPALWPLFQKKQRCISGVFFFPETISGRSTPILELEAIDSQTFKVILTQLQVKCQQWMKPMANSSRNNSTVWLLWCGHLGVAVDDDGGPLFFTRIALWSCRTFQNSQTYSLKGKIQEKNENFKDAITIPLFKSM